jgi:hypothetical protein
MTQQSSLEAFFSLTTDFVSQGFERSLRSLRRTRKLDRRIYLLTAMP